MTLITRKWSVCYDCTRPVVKLDDKTVDAVLTLDSDLVKVNPDTEHACKGA